jgi:heme/copper-type cytochrome/quinol oxidase subunit 4
MAISTTRTAKSGSAYAVGAWAVLMALTLASWWLGADHGPAGLGLDVTMVSILVLTFAKIAVVGHSFMELRESARWLTRTFFGWCVGMCLVLSVMYLVL